MTRGSVVVMLLLAASPAFADDFSGKWEVKQVQNERDGFPWSREVKYPSHMSLEVRDGRLVGHYTDQDGFTCEFPLVQVLNDGHDLVLSHCGVTKAPEAFAPIHHVKLRAGKLHGVVTTNERLFEWVAVKSR